jgi:hypothetical protein
MRGRGIARSFGLRDAQKSSGEAETCRLSIIAIPARLDALIFGFFSSISYNKPVDNSRGRLRLIAVKTIRVAEF